MKLWDSPYSCQAYRELVGMEVLESGGFPAYGKWRRAAFRLGLALYAESAARVNLWRARFLWCIWD